MQIHDPLPDISLPDLNGNIHNLSEYCGKLLLLVFWSAECPQSERVDLELEKYMQSWNDLVKIVRIASNRNEPLSMLKEVSELRGLKPIILDSDQEVADLLEAKTTPHCYIFNKNGNLVYQGAFDDLTFRRREAHEFYVLDVIKELLDGKNPAITETQPFGCSIVRY
jgi:thiol-disulfide isomerase/thioredoxin